MSRNLSRWPAHRRHLTSAMPAISSTRYLERRDAVTSPRTHRWPDGAPPLVLLNSVGSDRRHVGAGPGPAGRAVPRDAHRSPRARCVAGRARRPAVPASPTSAGDVLAVLDRLGLAAGAPGRRVVRRHGGMWLAVHHPERIAPPGPALHVGVHPTPARLDSTGPRRCAPAAWRPVADGSDRAMAHRRTSRPRPRSAGRACARCCCGIDAESYAQCCEAIAAMDLRADLTGSPRRRWSSPRARTTPSPADAGTPHRDQGSVDAQLEIVDGAAHVATSSTRRVSPRCCSSTSGGARTLAAGYATRRAVLGDEQVDRTIAAITPITRRSRSS